MALSIPDVVEKLVDNANLGKLVTDVGSGLALSVSVVMLLGLVGSLSVLPADRAPELRTVVAAAGARLTADQQSLRPVLQEFFAGTAVPAADSATLAQTTDPEALAGLGRRAIAAASSRLEILDAQVSALVARPDFPRAEVRALMDEKAPLAARNDRLLAQLELIDADRERLATARNELADALSFPNNLEVFTNNVTAVLAFAVIFGVILSQVSRLVFVTLIYEKKIPRTATVTSTEAVRAGRITRQQSDDLVRDYYRYVEGCINMVAPTALFGLVFFLYAGRKLEISAAARTAVLVVSVATAAALVVAGYYTYKEYRRRSDRLIG